MAELPPIRRIVTTHNEQGVAVVQSDERFETKVRILRVISSTLAIMSLTVYYVAYGSVPWREESTYLDFRWRTC